MINHKTLATASALAHNHKGATQEAHDLLAAHIARLTAERDRYRAALERIAGRACDAAIEAREALGQAQSQGTPSTISTS